MKFGPLGKVLLLTTVYTIFIAIVSFFLSFFSLEWLYDYYWYLLFYFYFITVVSLLLIERTAIKNPDDISKGFFGAMMLRLFVSVIIATIILYYDRESSTIFALNFIVIYLLYLGFEIYYLISILQPRINSEHQV
jgi:hypothetical protein